MKVLAIAILLFTINATAQPYQHYFGTLHSHSAYSDGNINQATSGVTTPAQSYQYAKDSYNFNFLGISDHNHSGAGMHLPDYAKGLYQADTTTKTGEFVALYGME